MAEPLAAGFAPVVSNAPANAASLEKWAVRAPSLIVTYFAIQLCVRLLISSNREVDDTEMVGQINWALGYSNSHAPLYHWIVRICYDLFGYWPAATVVPKYVLLATTFLLIYGAARRATASPIGGAVAVVFFFLIPVIFWKTQGKLTHSILGVAATAATLHAMVLVLTRPRASRFAWFGVALAIGLLAKYNFIFVIIALFVAVTCVADVRRIFYRRAALLAIVIPLVLSLPHWIWVGSHPALAMKNPYLLRVSGGPCECT
jgi:4-amino-4-deoxy-L-arabinose transferase-like glycosyltransferase